jgi:hypothetical protein
MLFWCPRTPSPHPSPCRAILARLLLHLLMELFHKLFFFRHSDAVWRVELCTGHFTPPSSRLDGWRGRLSPLWPPQPPPTATAATAVVGAPARDWLPLAFFLLLFLPPPPWGMVSALGLLSSLPARAAGECHARPSAALMHLSARLKSTETSWMSWVVSFSSVCSPSLPGEMQSQQKH